MAPTGWTTPKQLEFLNSKKVDFHAAKKKGKGASKAWMGNLSRDFFALWKDQETEQREWRELPPTFDKRGNVITERLPELFPSHEAWFAGRQSQLTNWLNNHPVGKRSRSGETAKVTITANPSSRRAPSEARAYSKMHYSNRVKELAQNDPLYNSKSRIAIITKHTESTYHDESDEVKAEVRKVVARRKAELERERESVDEVIERTPEEYALAIEKMPQIVHNLLSQLNARTGWSFTVSCGGPDPNQNGDITTMSIHSCVDMYGQSYAKATPDFQQTVLKPFSDYLHTIYSPDVCKSRALIPRDSEDEDEDDSHSSEHQQAPSATTSSEPTTPALTLDVVPPTSADGLLVSSMSSHPSANSNLGANAHLRPDMMAMSGGYYGDPYSNNFARTFSPYSTPVAHGPPLMTSLGSTSISGAAHPNWTFNAAGPSGAGVANTQVGPNMDFNIDSLYMMGRERDPSITIDFNTTSMYNFPAALPATHTSPRRSHPPGYRPSTSATQSDSQIGSIALHGGSRASLTGTQTDLAPQIPAAVLVPAPPISANVHVPEASGREPALSPTPAPIASAVGQIPNLDVNVGTSSTGALAAPPVAVPNPPAGISNGTSVLSAVSVPNALVQTPAVDVAPSPAPPPAPVNAPAPNAPPPVVQTSSTDVGAPSAAPVPAPPSPWRIIENLRGVHPLEPTPNPSGSADPPPEINPSDTTPDTGACTDSAQEIHPSGMTPAAEDADPAATNEAIHQPSSNDPEPHPSITAPLVGDNARSLRNRAVVEDHFPKWLSEACHLYLCNAVNVPAWRPFIEDFLQFERQFGNAKTSAHRMPAKLRPAILSTWVQNGKRRYDSPPTISESDLPMLADEWVTWWNSVQPVWRRSPAENSLPVPLSMAKGSENLDPIKKAGPVGFILVIIALAWWAPLHTTDARWNASLDDVHACVKLFLDAGQGIKRKPKEQGAGRGRKKQKM
ncbi:hypothetical protein HYPSUDRAFT_200645 [Hypholoma sublateritium FD-334 SS-4]|uniref:Uncharacterized protein n=1 Tax=Hypholoma sublateritium (strain FD-334 SS-4) TaxID=945553 RepID=A0A0D2LB02_HYPSF|nr:hypothetical protein HYPSUDRAFT_200645 [Hypholoma sublateritium FD-334 SS-4]